MIEELPKRRAWNIATGEWWWVAGYIVHMALNQGEYVTHTAKLPSLEWDITNQSNGVSLRGMLNGVDILLATIVGTHTHTFISATEGKEEPFDYFWGSIVDPFTAIEKEVRSIKRQSTGAKFKDVIDDFYRRRRAGDSPNLRALADEYGVNYGSLRQAKVIYDKDKRENL